MTEKTFCSYCKKEFVKENEKSQKDNLWRQKAGINIYCSRECRLLARGYNPKPKPIYCAHCGKQILSNANYKIKKNKSDRRFCNSSCAASYNNTHKTHGTRRSRLEKWIESKLSIIYPNLEIKYCDKTEINSELDIFIPSLRLAFELNGIYHYEPIHGKDKLNRIQQNDKNKFQLCQQHNISLCIIDTSKHSYITEKTCKPYLDIIVKIINESLL